VVKPDFGHRQVGRIVFGLFIIVVGLFALLDNLHLFDSHLVQPYWPLVFVALGALKLGQNELARRRWLGVAFIAVGAAMTANNLGLIRFQVRDWWPLLLVGAGLLVIFKRGDGPRGRWRHRRHVPGALGCDGRHDERVEHGARVDASAVMSGIVLKNDSQAFQGGEISTVMGAVEVDLRQASIAGEARLHLSVIMGGVEIKVPRDWSISIAGTPTLGGIEDKTIPPMAPGKRLVIEGSVVMGGVEISN
jgi:predicted membrane protein